MPPTPIPRHLMPEDSPSPRSPSSPTSSRSSPPAAERETSPSSPPPRPRSPPLNYPRLAEQSKRVALVLDRFSLRCPIEYCSNDYILETTRVLGRSFFDFVAPEDEEIVQQYITTVKTWGVNERGQPADGGFGYGKFAICPQGRDSRFVFFMLAPYVHRKRCIGFFFFFLVVKIQEHPRTRVDRGRLMLGMAPVVVGTVVATDHARSRVRLVQGDRGRKRRRGVSM
jgi:hypothetical protein